jgi:hypothetical protein
VEAIEIGEIIDIANIDAVFMHVVENMLGRQKGLGEYPTNLRQGVSASSP